MHFPGSKASLILIVEPTRKGFVARHDDALKAQSPKIINIIHFILVNRLNQKGKLQFERVFENADEPLLLLVTTEVLYKSYA